jgi:hypothetical protein
LCEWGLLIHRPAARGWRIDKGAHDPQIDAVVTLAVCVDRAEQPAAEPVRLLGWL